ncbi:MAG TPA: redoxin domain-containing protein [Ilumatobacteraceae bacterium]|nr:redoxin domain-containing protein [Ilumatobacteraceae bacterium]
MSEASTAAPTATRRGRVAPIIVLAVAVAMGGLFWLLIGAKSGDGADSNYTPLLDKAAPAVKTTTLDGQTFDLQRRKGSWVVLNFFQSTCVPCVREHPELIAFAEQQADRGVYGAELYTVVSLGDPIDKVTEFFAANGGTWPILRDDDANIQVSFGVYKVPETWIIDPDGRVVFRTIAQVTADSLTRELGVQRSLYEQRVSG